MGIDLYRLRNPRFCLEGNSTRSSVEDIRLIIVTSVLLRIDDPFINDVARAMKISKYGLHIVKPEELEMLRDHQKDNCFVWFLGQGRKSSCTFKKITSPSLQLLKKNSNAKRELWEKLSNLVSSKSV
jgi:DNA polymerase III psi subunit